jgi:copper oxidase (laccase) domain-containing protein
MTKQELESPDVNIDSAMATDMARFAENTGLRLAHSSMADGNMHPNLEQEHSRNLAQQRFESFCERHGFQPSDTVGMRVDPRLGDIADFVRVSGLLSTALGTVEPELRPQAQGLIANRDDNIALFTLAGDCYPVVFAPADHPEYSLIHLNWRAIEAGIGCLALEALGARASTMRVFVGPGIQSSFNWHSAQDIPRQAADPRWARYIQYCAEHPFTGEEGVTLDLLGKFFDDIRSLGILERNIVVDRRTTHDPQLFSRRETLLGGGKSRGNNVFIVGTEDTKIQ